MDRCIKLWNDKITGLIQTTQDNLRDNVKFLLVIAVLFFAPALVPLFIVTSMAVLAIAGGILGVCVMFCCAFFPVLLGIFTVPFFVIAVVTTLVYVSLKIARSFLMKTEKLDLPFMLHNKLVDAFWSLSIVKPLNLQVEKNSTREIQNYNYHEKTELDKMDSWGNIPSFEAEMEEESKHITIPNNWNFPFPVVSRGNQGMSDYDREEVECLIEKIEELHQIVCSLRTPLVIRRGSRRKTL